MLNTCSRCGLSSGDKAIDPQGPYAICPACGYRQPFRRLPLLLVGGAAGAGKSSLCRYLLESRLRPQSSLHPASTVLDRVVLLDADILWRPAFNQPEEGYREFFETWLCTCRSINQSGRPVVLFGAGTSVPHNLEPLTERRYFSALHYLALVCQGDELERRIRSRAQRSDSTDLDFICEHRKFNRWFIQNAHQTEPPVELIETTDLPLPKVAERVLDWISGVLDPAN